MVLKWQWLNRRQWWCKVTMVWVHWPHSQFPAHCRANMPAKQILIWKASWKFFFKNFIHNEFLLLCIPLLIYFQTPQYSCIYYHAEICIFKPIYVLIEKLSSKKSLTVARRLQKLWTQMQMKLHKADLWRNTIDGVPVCCTRHTQLICTGYASNNCYFSPHCAALDKGLLFSLKSWVCPVSWTETEVLQFTILYLWDIAKDTFS